MKIELSEPTVLSNLALMIAGALDTYDCDGMQLLERVGIDYEYALDPDTRIPFSVSEELWQLAAEESGDPCFGLTVAETFRPAALHGLGFSWMASGTLKDAFVRAVRFQRLINTGSNFHTEVDSRYLRVIPQLRDPKFAYHPAHVIGILAGILRMSRLTVGTELNPAQVTLRIRRPPCSARMKEFFRAEMKYQSKMDSMAFDLPVLEAPVLAANPQLARANDQVVVDYLAKYDREKISLKARSSIVEQLPAGKPSQENIATALNLSRRSFQRKLRNEGTSFRQLVEQTREQLAIQYVSDGERSIGEISFLLGFSEHANFSRSFKRWTGRSPKEYRLSTRMASSS